MKKQLQRIHGGFAALFGAFLFVILGLGACVNPLQETKERSPDGSTGVRISIVAGEARTLLPTATFSSYVVQFEDSDDVETAPAVILTDTDPKVISLAPDVNWIITVTAYIEVNDSGVAAAEGTATVTLTEGEIKGVPIRVSAKTGGAPGSFSYDVSYPVDVTGGSLELYNSSLSKTHDIDLIDYPNGDNISLAPGYYRLKIALETDYGMAVRTEIVHIYSAMETRGDFTFAEADFGSPLNISGTVDLSGLGTVDQAKITLYRYADFTDPEGSVTESDPSGAWLWAIPMLAFSQPTDLYVELRITLVDGELVKRLSAPISVFDQDSTVNVGRFTANSFNLSGVVGVDELTGLSVSDITGADVAIYGDGAVPVFLGGAVVDAGDGSWSFTLLTEESSLPARVVLMTQTLYGVFYDEIRTTLTGDRSDLDFSLKSVSAGPALEGAALPTADYKYLFVPDSSGGYAFALSGAGSQGVGLTLYNAVGSSLVSDSGSSDLAFSQTLSGGNVYYLALNLNSPNRAFRFQIKPVVSVALGGIVDFAPLLAPFEGAVTVSYATIAMYADNSFHTPLGYATINTVDGSWSATVNFVESPIPAVFAITATLSNGRVVNHSERLAISGDDTGLAFSPAIVAEGSPVVRTIVGQYDRFLFVPAATGDYSLGIKGQAGSSKTLKLYDSTGLSISDTNGSSGELELRLTEGTSLTEGELYLVELYNDSPTFETYRFQAEALLSATLSGTVSLVGLAPLTAAGVDHTEIYVFTGPSGSVYLGGTTAAINGSWSLSVPVSGSQAVRIAAVIYLNNGREIFAQRQDTIRGNTVRLDLAPATLALANGQPLSRTALGSGDAFLFVPSVGGLFTLEAFSGNGTPGLSLYNAAGAPLALSGNGSLLTELGAGIPYIVQVDSLGSFATYRVQLTATASALISGSVDYSGLPSSIRSKIRSGTVSGYLGNVQIAGGAPVNSGGAWSALVPSYAIGQEAYLILTLNLDNDLSIAGHIGAPSLSGSALKFAPAAVTGELNSKTGAEGSDSFLFVPEEAGRYTLEAQKTGVTIGLTVYDGLTGSQIASDSSSGLIEIVSLSLNKGAPYIVQVDLSGHSSPDYQFYSGPALTLGGTVGFSGLSSWTTASAKMFVFAPSGANYALAETAAVSLEDGSWSIKSLMPDGDKFFALVARSSEGEGVLATRSVSVSVSGNPNNINFTPADTDKNVATGTWHTKSVSSGSTGTWLLWIPGTAGKYALDAEQTGSSITPYMYLYDGLTGGLIASNYSWNGTVNAHIERNDFAKGHPYLVRVRDWSNGSGSFKFKAEAPQ
jgi:hypothetical protein